MDIFGAGIILDCELFTVLSSKFGEFSPVYRGGTVGCRRSEMKKAVLATVMMLALFSAGAKEGSSLSVCLDIRSFDALFLPTLQAEAVVRLHLDEEFSLRIPLSLTSDLLYNEARLWETGLFLDYHPFGNGAYLSVSLLQIGIFSGADKPEGGILYLNEVAFGYTWRIGKALYLEPRLSVRDPSGVFEDEYELVSRTFPDRSKFRFSVLFGWEFLSIPNF